MSNEDGIQIKVRDFLMDMVMALIVNHLKASVFIEYPAKMAEGIDY